MSVRFCSFLLAWCLAQGLFAKTIRLLPNIWCWVLRSTCSNMKEVFQGPSGFSALPSKLLGRVVPGLRWHVVGVEAHGQANKSSRSCVVRVPQTLCQASLQQHGAKQRGGVALDQWPPSRVQKSILCVRVRRTFQSLVNSVIFHQLSRCPRRLVTDICDRPSKHVVLSLGRCRDSSSGLAPKQVIPSELLGRVVGGLNWHVVGVEPPKQVSQELDDFRDEGTSNTLPGFVTTARFPNFDAQLRRVP